MTTSPLFTTVTSFLLKVWTSLSTSRPLPDDDGSYVVSRVVDGRVYRKSHAHVMALMRG